MKECFQFMRILIALYNFIKRKLGIYSPSNGIPSPSNTKPYNISKYVIDDLKYYERYGKDENIK